MMSEASDHDLLIQIHSVVTDLRERVKDLEGRIVKLEQMRWKIGGAVAVVAPLAAIGGHFALKALGI